MPPSTWTSTGSAAASSRTDEWIDLLIRSIGLEPSHFDRRLKLLFLIRLLPLCEPNYNLVELGPRGTGKSYAYQELSPYAILLTGPTTVANLFYNMATGKMGLVGIWDAIAFDEVADLQKMPKEVVTTLKTYCESGMFARGKDALSGQASLAMFGNTNQPVEVMVRSSHLFVPMPDVIREDMAFLDRIHYYIPGWEIPKMRVEFFTDHYGFVVDYLAEALRELRKHNFTEIIDRHFSLGSHLNARDVKAVRKTVSGLVKLLYPHGELSRQELAELVEMALEGRRRVKEQLKKMGSFEYHQTSFSYIDNETREERFVGVPEQGGREMISTDPWLRARSTPPRWTTRARSGSIAWRSAARRGPASSRSQAVSRDRCRSRSSGPSPTSRARRGRWASPSRWTRPTSTSRRSTC